MASFRSLQALMRAPSSHTRFTARHQTAYTASTIRTYRNTASRGLPYKNDQDRQSVKPKEIEGGASHTAEATADTDAAFDPSKTRPEEQEAAADRETGSSGSKGDSSNPLDSSGANPEASPSVGKGGGPEMKEPIKGGEKKTSSHGSPQKKGKPPVA
ncbi:unnamed protein product [Discula destructiva]